MSKGSWPQLIPEVAYNCNSMINAASKISPFKSSSGRQPRSQIDLWFARLRTSEQNSQGEYLSTLIKKKNELQIIAREKNKARDRYMKASEVDTEREDNAVTDAHMREYMALVQQALPPTRRTSRLRNGPPCPSLFSEASAHAQ